MTEQLAIDFSPGQQRRELSRTTGRIGPVILRVLDRWRRAGEREFRMSELAAEVAREIDGIVAPGSTDRVLRGLRKEGAAKVELVSRSGSLYRLA